MRLLTSGHGRCKLAPRGKPVDDPLARFGEELDDAVGGGARGGIGDGPPRAVERTARDRVLLRDRAELLAVGSTTCQSMRMLCLPPLASDSLTMPLTI